MTQSRVGVSPVSSLMGVVVRTPVVLSSDLESSLVRLTPPPRLFRATPLVLRSSDGETSPFINGRISISEDAPLDGELLPTAGRGRSEDGIGRL
eukprot:CAMPEP_0196243904 /NCGR_PEP_ID=MMETSP0913-20130531/29271_1 /TAXON_ID=49265 /ORGANISM="Thalassiosira rotula, Strain GSO102" /LENGTH=93 /DNA_ID=CAMNT_0041527627 /DNA_START=29 /DNA_END=310 /DNA_ORIENTATION=-